MQLILRALAYLVLLGLMVEVYLVGAVLFAGMAFEPHRTLGHSLGPAILILLVLALITRPGRRVVGLSLLLVALTLLQFLLPSLRGSVPWAAALHAINALALLGVTAAIARSAGAPATHAEARAAQCAPSEP
jgi:hypothetical protein